MSSKDRAKGSISTQRSLKTTMLIIIIFISVWVTGQFVNAGGNLVMEARKLTYIMKLIQQVYVEEPDLDRLTEGAIEGMLKRLDPHSIYIPSKEQVDIDERDLGEFEGIGISFVIENELITVISPINGTPAERLGIRSGDKIVEIDGINAYGITNDEVFKKLRGPKGTTVKIKIIRDGVSEPLEFTIVRDTIPIHSVWTSFMLDDSTGYVMLNQFMQTSTDELEEALKKLEAQGMIRLVFDLRNNQGGRLTQAVSVADIFIPGGKTLVSRHGRTSREDSVYTSTDAATHPMFDLIVLINGGSASASEIVSGAIQDLDRGLIIGSKSFGKGLVQYPYRLQDGAVIRLSTAHWYTPSGRLVQRPYDKGRGEYYAVRYKDPDTLQTDEKREVYHTLGGREVYPYSGITPDVVVEPYLMTVATARLLSARILFNYAESLVKEKNLEPDGDFQDFLKNFKLSLDDLNGLIPLAKEKEIPFTEEILQKDFDYISNEIKADLAQLLWNDRNNYYMVRFNGDNVVKKAMESFNQAEEIASIWH